MIMTMTTATTTTATATTTHRVEFVSWCDYPKRLLCCSHHKVTKKDGIVALPSVGIIWDVLMCNFAAIVSHLRVAHPRCVFCIIRSIINSNTKIYFQMIKLWYLEV
jgi:hypothetical protein